MPQLNRNEQIYPKVYAAIQFLLDHCDPFLTVVHRASSDYYYGQKLPVRCDRIRLEFILDQGRKLPCQVIFNSRDYQRAPDIIIDHPLVLSDPKKLLPDGSEWDISDEKCLFTWLKNVHALLDKRNSEGKSSRTTKKRKTSPSPVVEPKRRRSPAEEVQDDDDGDDVVRPKRDLFSALVQGRKFLAQWIKRWPDHLVQCDTDNYLSLTLYWTVKIPQDILSEMQSYRQRAISTLNSNVSTRVTAARDTASALVQFRLDKEFPFSPVNITLISAVNTESDTNYVPDRREFEHHLPPQASTTEMVDDIRQRLLTEIPRFHSRLFHND